jgi:hypothetical protein
VSANSKYVSRHFNALNSNEFVDNVLGAVAYKRELGKNGDDGITD